MSNCINSWNKLTQFGYTQIITEVSILEYVINFDWDDETNVWIATSDDVPGLVLESSSFDALLERTRVTVPELLALNLSENNPIGWIVAILNVKNKK